MKRTLLAICLSAIAGVAFAGGPQSLKTVSVNQNSPHVIDCTPPNDLKYGLDFKLTRSF